ncbi:hypothetical protein HPB47_016772 [Ixodes persulcatus]|uniref:Uncharacterized protein n=1 Tax=Ixodes persulcatus TaxID=34615 RepID=A0AC60QQ58_IXOPE|nr:hypothetical protein HPB47_016772 [Ixodes persulcatus]
MDESGLQSQEDRPQSGSESLPSATCDNTGTVKYHVGSASVPDRTKEGVERSMAEAFETGTHVQGVMGPSALINVAGFDIVWSFIPDYMHCELFGVTRQFLELRLSIVGAAYYIESPQLLKEIDERHCHIKLPQCVARLPRSVRLRKIWKATEWQLWLLYFRLVCVEGGLPGCYLTHFSLVVRGIFCFFKMRCPPPILLTARTAWCSLF